MKSDRSYLRRINRAWYFRIKVPKGVRDLYGDREILEIALHTRDQFEANLRKLPLLAQYKREFAAASSSTPSQREALAVREQLRDLRSKPSPDGAHKAAAIESVLEDKAESMVDKQGVPIAAARRWLELARAETMTIVEARDQWLAEAGYKEQTAQHHRQSTSMLLTVLGGDALPSSVTDEFAVEFVRQHIRGLARSYSTKRNRLNSLFRLWAWMAEHLIVPRGRNPWAGFKLQKRNAERTTPEKRGFTDQELETLFRSRPAYPGMADLMVLGLYTGARINELCSLTAGDVTSERSYCLFRVTKSKTPAGIRTVAVVHREAMKILKRRSSSSTDPAAFLFPEFTPGGEDDKRSHSVSKAFGRYRRECGVPDGTDFHSFRRTAITQLINKRELPGLIASFVGHEGGTLAQDVYSDGPWKKTLRDVAAKIVYRKPVEKAVAEFLQPN